MSLLPPRPDKLHGTTYAVPTPSGTLHLTVNKEGSDLVETFLNLGRRGETTHAMAEAIGRLISLLLRMDELGTKRERAWLVVDQLDGIGGGTPVGLGPARIASVPDAVAKVLRELLEESSQ